MKAIVLERRDVREFDQLITLLTENFGKKNYLARGVKKILSKNSSFLEPCSVIDVETVKGQEVDYIIRALPIFLFKEIRQDAKKCLPILYLSKVINQILREEEKDVSIFELFHSWLFFVNDIIRFNDEFIYSFLLKLFRILGFTPALKKCVLKGEDIEKNNSNYILSASLGGIVCKNCEKNVVLKTNLHIFVSIEEFKNLQIILDNNWDEIYIEKISKSVSNFIEQFGIFHLEKKIPSWSNFKKNTAF